MRWVRRIHTSRYATPAYCHEAETRNDRVLRDPIEALLRGCTLSLQSDANAFDPYNRTGRFIGHARRG